MKRFLIVKVGAIGDAVMALPMVMKLRDLHPDAEITWLGGSLIRPLVEMLGVVNRYVEVDEHKLYHGSIVAKGLALVSIWRHIGLRYFSKIYLMHPDDRFRMLVLLCKGDLLHMKHGSHFRSDTYHAQTYMDVVQSGAAICYPIMFPKKNGGQHVVLFPGGAKNTMREQSLRRWPLERYVKLAHLFKEEGWQVTILGGASDEWIRPSFHGYTCVIGESSLRGLGQAIADADVFITHDTGPMHVAKLTETKTYAIFGPVDPRARVGGHGTVVPVYRRSFSCQPCYDGKHFAKCSNNVCLKQISPEEVCALALEGASAQARRQ